MHKSRPLAMTTTPFDNIALAFSGGGFRAGSFSLGTLSYLHSIHDDTGKPLLQHVTYISSASGGTITNAMYSLCNAEGKSFGEFYKKLYDSMEGICLLEDVFTILNDQKDWANRKDKQVNLINAFAMSYDKDFYDGKLLGNLYKEQPVTHLDEVCFNTTDFYRGLLFRQTVKLRPDKDEGDEYLYGNYIVNLKEATAHKLKLGDLVAASSCFPAGFEPIVFPNDFSYTGLDKEELLKNLRIQLQEMNTEELNLLYGQDTVKNEIGKIIQPATIDKIIKQFENVPLQKEFKFGMMDGGITDNQGLESLMRANERRVNGSTNFKEFDLMLIADVGSHYMEPYKVPQTEKFKGWKKLTIRNLRLICFVLVAAGLFGNWYIFSNKEYTLWPMIGAMLSTTVMLLGLAGLGIIYGLKKVIKSKMPQGDTGGTQAKTTGDRLGLDSNFPDNIVELFFNHFGRTPIGALMRMVMERGSSILTLNNDVFLKRIRQLLYQRFFAEGYGCFRMKSNHVYDLSFSNDRIRKENDAKGIDPSTDMQKVAQAAFEMGTTLWFDKQSEQKHTLSALIACGQFTACYNLLDYISKMKQEYDGKPSCYSKLDKTYQLKVDHIENQVRKDYNDFKTDPFYLCNRLGKQYNINNFKECRADEFPFPQEFEHLRAK